MRTRFSQRYHWARAHGVKAEVAKMLAKSIRDFRAFVVEQGVDPDSLGDFARRASTVSPDKPRSSSAKNVRRRRIYHELRGLGATPDQATMGSHGSFSQARVMRELRGSAFRQQKENANV